MILATRHGDREMFGAFDSSTPIPPPGQYGASMSFAGKRVDLASAVGLPAFLRGWRLLRETTAQMPPMVYEGFGKDRKPAPQASQLAVLRRPNEDMTRFAFMEFVVGSMMKGGAYIWKVKVGGTVRALYPLDPRLVKVKVTEGRVEFEIRERVNGPVKRRVGRDHILHIPGILLDHPCKGVSIVEAARHGVGTQLARQEFEGRYLANDGHPGVILKHEGSPDAQQRREVRDGFDARHQGYGKAGRTGTIWGGWSLEKLDISLKDAEWIASQKFAVQDVGRMLGVPGGLLGDPDAPGSDSPEQENMRFLAYGLSPWMTRYEEGVAADPDLFPQPTHSVELDPSFLLRADIKTRYEAHRAGRQGGWITANEIRTDEGRPLIEGGDKLLETPVGGAPNPSSTTNT